MDMFRRHGLSARCGIPKYDICTMAYKDSI